MGGVRWDEVGERRLALSGVPSWSRNVKMRECVRCVCVCIECGRTCE